MHRKTTKKKQQSFAARVSWYIKFEFSVQRLFTFIFDHFFGIPKATKAKGFADVFRKSWENWNSPLLRSKKLKPKSIELMETHLHSVELNDISWKRIFEAL